MQLLEKVTIPWFEISGKWQRMGAGQYRTLELCSAVEFPQYFLLLSNCSAIVNSCMRQLSLILAGFSSLCHCVVELYHANQGKYTRLNVLDISYLSTF